MLHVFLVVFRHTVTGAGMA